MSWADFWNRDTPIYVNERHKALHYRLVARDIAALISAPDAVVLDHGCGEALSAERIASACGRLYLCDAAPLVRERLADRFRHNRKITVLAPDEVEALPDHTLDLVVANSVAQYLSVEELRALLLTWRTKLKSDGRLVLADIIPHAVSPVQDARALLAFAWKGGFTGAALAGLARTAFSDYRKLREELGFTQYDEAEMLALLADHGYAAERLAQNVGHNPARMSFEAKPN